MAIRLSGDLSLSIYPRASTLRHTLALLASAPACIGRDHDRASTPAHYLCFNCLLTAQSTSATRPVSQTSPLARLRRSVYYIFVFFLTRSASWLLGSNFYWESARPTARQFEDNHFIWAVPICTLFSVRSPRLSLWSLQLWLRLMG